MITSSQNQVDAVSILTPPAATKRQYRQIELEYNPEIRMLWNFMKPNGPSNFNLGLLEELRHHDAEFEKNGGKHLYNNQLCPVDYYVFASHIPHIFNLGGDLALFIMLIKARDRDALLHYASLCIDCIYPRICNFNSPAITISLVQGDALGGGFECALTSNLIIAERSARMGFPEIIFNLFPGMGAYSLLARRIGARAAEEMIASGNIFQAEDLHKMGLVDILVPDGEGEKALFDLARQQNKHRNGLRAMYECRQHYQPVQYSELMKIATIWVDAALRLNDKDLQMMSRLVRAQLKQIDQRRQNDIANGLPDLELAAA
jgi:DSF synthase